MDQFLDAVRKIDLGLAQTKSVISDEERLWLVTTILILSEKAGLVTFRRPKTTGKRTKQGVPLPKGLISLLESCEKQGLITINRGKLEETG